MKIIANGSQSYSTKFNLDQSWGNFSNQREMQWKHFHVIFVLLGWIDYKTTLSLSTKIAGYNSHVTKTAPYPAPYKMVNVYHYILITPSL